MHMAAETTLLEHHRTHVCMMMLLGLKRQVRLFKLHQGERSLSVDLKICGANLLSSITFLLLCPTASSQLVHVTFPDSEIASKFACKYTKTAAIVIEASAPAEQERTIKYAKAGSIALMVDKSNYMDDDKGCTIVLRVINIDFKCVENRFLDISVCNRATSANLIQVIDNCMKSMVFPGKM